MVHLARFIIFFQSYEEINLRNYLFTFHSVSLPKTYRSKKLNVKSLINECTDELNLITILHCA